MLARTFARIDRLAWDMEARIVDVTITSVRNQDITLIARHGIEKISAPAGVLAADAPAGHGRLRRALAGGKAGGITLEAWPARAA